MTIDLVPRGEWRARTPKGNYSGMPNRPRGVKIHYTGGRVKPELLDDHSLCDDAVRGIQNGHMDGNGWIDIGYSFVVCHHRRVYVARGLGNVPAANGPGLNSGHYAILGLVGNAGLEEPSDGLKHGIRDCIEYIRSNTGTGSEIKGHRDGYATDCPGPRLYEWVKQGAPRPDGETDDMPTAAEIAKAVWQHELPVQWGTKENPAWQAQSILREGPKQLLNHKVTLESLPAEIDALKVELDGVKNAVNDVVGQLAALRDQLMVIDPATVVEKIKEALDAVQIKLDTEA